jgi:4-hydroxy-tetrahydrodipicolinate synthase
MLTSADLIGALIPAVPAPFDAEGNIDASAQELYARWMARQPAEGVAVWAHTGRGLHLSESQRALVLESWRRFLPAPRIVVAAAGGPAHLADFNQVILAAGRMGRQARDMGADALLVHPPRVVHGRPDQEGFILEYHSAIAGSGLPLLLFHLYEAAGGVRYEPGTLIRLLAMPEVIGIKVATLDSVVTFQDLATSVQESSSSKVLITGEDRFLGYSLMCGAQAALIGMGAAATSLQAQLLHTYRNGPAGEFLRLNRLVDDLARHTFCAPMEGYIQRMLWCLVHQGVLTREAAHDPWAPALDPLEFERLGQCLGRVLGEHHERAGLSP